MRGRVWVHGRGAVRLGDGVSLDAAAAPIELHAGRGAELVVGGGTVIEGGASIEAMQSIRIGRDCRLGAFCKVIDNDFHTRGDREHRPPSQPVEVGDGATVGPRSVLLPGSRVEPGAQVPAAAVWSARVRR